MNTRGVQTRLINNLRRVPPAAWRNPAAAAPVHLLTRWLGTAARWQFVFGCDTPPEVAFWMSTRDIFFYIHALIRTEVLLFHLVLHGDLARVIFHRVPSHNYTWCVFDSIREIVMCAKREMLPLLFSLVTKGENFNSVGCIWKLLDTNCCHALKNVNYFLNSLQIL